MEPDKRAYLPFVLFSSKEKCR